MCVYVRRCRDSKCLHNSCCVPVHVYVKHMMWTTGRLVGTSRLKYFVNEFATQHRKKYICHRRIRPVAGMMSLAWIQSIIPNVKNIPWGNHAKTNGGETKSSTLYHTHAHKTVAIRYCCRCRRYSSIHVNSAQTLTHTHEHKQLSDECIGVRTLQQTLCDEAT